MTYMTYMLTFDVSAIHIIFVVWVEFVKTIFSCLNLKSHHGFLPYNMPEIFNKLYMASQTL